MQVQANITSTAQQQPKPAENVDANRKKVEKNEVDIEKSGSAETSSVQPEEILTQINKLTEDGLFSVRFEKSPESNQLIIKVVNREGETIRQIPANSVLGVSSSLHELSGKMIDQSI